MKKLIIFLLVVNSFANNEIKEIINMIKILQKVDFKYQPIQRLYNPFTKKIKKKKLPPIIVKQMSIKKEMKKKVEKSYKLEVIFQNKVRINGMWYKNGDKLDEYKVVIKNNLVYLEKKGNLIPLTNKKSLLKVSE